MEAEKIAGFANQRQFLVVELSAGEMRITPVSTEPLDIRDPSGQPVEMPIVVKR